jgi:hypothetical protein
MDGSSRRYTLHSTHMAGGRGTFPPDNELVTFSSDGLSGPVTAATMLEAIKVPGFTCYGLHNQEDAEADANASIAFEREQLEILKREQAAELQRQADELARQAEDHRKQLEDQADIIAHNAQVMREQQTEMERMRTELSGLNQENTVRVQAPDGAMQIMQQDANAQAAIKKAKETAKAAAAGKPADSNVGTI